MADLSSNDHFLKVLSVAHEQLQNKKIQIRFGPQGKMRFIIDEESLKARLLQSALDDAIFRTVFHNEIGPLLEAIIRGALDQYIENAPGFSAYDEDPSKRAARKEVLQARAQQVSKTLVNDQLRARYLITVSSKHPRLRAAAWEIAKKSELSTKEPWLRHYATLSFEAIKPESLGFLTWFPFLPSEGIGRTESIVFDCDEGDLDDLIKALQDARAALEKVGI
jgi:hypothetical protein